MYKTIPIDKQQVFTKNDLYLFLKNEDISNYYIVISDIDNFKEINDNFGYKIGDKVIEYYGKRMAKLVVNLGKTYQFNGDEFILLLEKNKIKNIKVFIKNLREKLNKLFLIHNYEIPIASTFGIYEIPFKKNIDDVIKKAYIALHNAKEEKKVFAYYNGKTEESIKRKTNIIKELKKALTTNNYEGFYMVYQPIYSIRKNKIEEVEALIRWENKVLGIIPPSEFIPLAEQTGMIKELGYWVIKKVLEEIKKWKEENLDLKVSINLSPEQIKEKDFFRKLKRLIEKENINYSQIKFEITETQILDLKEEKFYKLRELIELGLDIALDDFGNGYSSMKNIVFFPINEIKIDKHFIDYIHKDKKIELLIASIVEFANKVGYRTTAEGVELKEQFYKLKALGCHRIQGYYIAKPIKTQEIKSHIAHFSLF